MLDFQTLNYWAVAVAWLINVVVGAFWYSPNMYGGKTWKKHTGVDMMKMPQNEATRIIGFVAVSAAIQAYILAVLVSSLVATEAIEGLKVGLLVWTFVAATTIGVTLYSRKSWKFWLINNSYFLLVITVNAIILSVWLPW